MNFKQPRLLLISLLGAFAVLRLTSVVTWPPTWYVPLATAFGVWIIEKRIQQFSSPAPNLRQKATWTISALSLVILGLAAWSGDPWQAYAAVVLAAVAFLLTVMGQSPIAAVLSLGFCLWTTVLFSDSINLAVVDFVGYVGVSLARSILDAFSILCLQSGSILEVAELAFDGSHVAAGPIGIFALTTAAVLWSAYRKRSAIVSTMNVLFSMVLAFASAAATILLAATASWFFTRDMSSGADYLLVELAVGIASLGLVLLMDQLASKLTFDAPVDNEASHGFLWFNSWLSWPSFQLAKTEAAIASSSFRLDTILPLCVCLVAIVRFGPATIATAIAASPVSPTSESLPGGIGEWEMREFSKRSYSRRSLAGQDDFVWVYQRQNESLLVVSTYGQQKLSQPLRHYLNEGWHVDSSRTIEDESSLTHEEIHLVDDFGSNALLLLATNIDQMPDASIQVFFETGEISQEQRRDARRILAQAVQSLSQGEDTGP